MDPVRVQDSLDRLRVSIGSQPASVTTEAGAGDTSPSQGLRLINAFSKIRNHTLRQDVIVMIEALADCPPGPDRRAC